MINYARIGVTFVLLRVPRSESGNRGALTPEADVLLMPFCFIEQYTKKIPGFFGRDVGSKTMTLVCEAPLNLQAKESPP